MEIGVFHQKKANLTENVMAVKSWIKLVPNAAPITQAAIIHHANKKWT